MSFIDNLTTRQLIEIRDIMDLPSEEGKGEVVKKLAAQYGVNDWYFYRKRRAIEDKLNGVESEKGKVTGTSTLLDGDGNVKLQWVKEKTVDPVADAVEAIENVVATIERKGYVPVKLQQRNYEDLLTVYISNDVHLGALMWGKETFDRDWDLDIAEIEFKTAIDNLIRRAPATDECIVADLGDLTEMDDFKNMTPKSGNILDVDGRYPRVLEVAMECMRYFVEQALYKHKTVRFLNISGNHDITTGYAITAFMKAWFKDEPRVVVDDGVSKQRYYKFGNTMLGFAHGDGLRMRDAGEVMAMHRPKDFAETTDRYYHFGHIHKDAIYDGRLCKSESHRNLAPLNAWAADKGFGRNAGTMKAIVYDRRHGEDTRITYKVVTE